MKRQRPTRVAFALIPLAVASACGELRGTPDGVEVTDSAGVTLVTYAGADRPAPWILGESTVLAGVDGAPSSVPWGVVADPAAGKIYVLDAIGNSVVAFDRSGASAQRFGRQGGGPGEFRHPAALSLDESGALAVWDAGRGILSRWSSEGTLLNEEQVPVDFWGPGFHVGPDVVLTVTAESTPEEIRQSLIRLAPDGGATLHQESQTQVLMQLPCATMPAPRLFSPSIVWTAEGDTTYLLNGRGYRIDVRVANTLAASYRRNTPAVRITEEMAVRSVELGPFAGFARQCGVTAEHLARAVGHEEVAAPVLWITRDPAGRLWVSLTSNGLTPDRADILDPQGRYLGTLTMDGIPVAFVSETEIVALSIGEMGQTVLTLYQLQPAPKAVDDGEAATSQVQLVSGLREFRDCEQCPVMVELPPGRFVMGSPESEEEAAGNGKRPEHTILAEKPQVEVEIDYPLAVGKFEVTFAEWDYCIEAGGCSYRPDDMGWGRGERPVINLSRPDVQQYLDWVSRHTGQEYRLPSGAEWEYAARGGTSTARHWGDQLGRGNAVCDGCGSRWDKRSTAPVGSFAPNRFGLHDMLGNAQEWVADCWHANHEGHPGTGAARIESSPSWKNGICERPANRGGSWDTFGWTVRAAARNSWRPGPWSDREADYGFRVVRTVASDAAVSVNEE